jgi:acyl-CoA thioester hydrolase
MTANFTQSFTATPETIDELGHVNNAVWVQWIQAVATGHWQAVAPPEHQAAYIWVVVRHEIDYLRALGPGESVTARTWVADAPQGAKFDRYMEFTAADGRVHVRAKTSWALLDKASGRPLRVTAEVIAPFLANQKP